MNIQVELTNYCNLACVECPHHLMKRPKEHMTEEVFERVLDYIEKINPGSVILNKDGDPLIHPQVLPFIRRISNINRECGIDIYTNGILLTEQFISSLAVLPNRVRLLVTFHYYNHDGTKNDYSKVGKVLLNSVRKKYPRIYFIFVTHATDLISTKELTEFRQFWDTTEQGFDTVVNYTINPWSRKQIHQKHLKEQTPNCPYEDNKHLFIGNTGNILSCCADLEEENIIANIAENDIDLALTKVENFYYQMRQSKLSELCEICLSE